MALKRHSSSQENVDRRKSETHSSLFSCVRQSREIEQLHVLEFSFVYPAGFLLGIEKEENKHPGLSSSASSHLGEILRAKVAQNLLSLHVIQQPTLFPQDIILSPASTTAVIPMGCLGVQLAQEMI